MRLDVPITSELLGGDFKDLQDQMVLTVIAYKDKGFHGLVRSLRDYEFKHNSVTGRTFFIVLYESSSTDQRFWMNKRRKQYPLTLGQRKDMCVRCKGVTVNASERFDRCEGNFSHRFLSVKYWSRSLKGKFALIVSKCWSFKYFYNDILTAHYI